MTWGGGKILFFSIKILRFFCIIIDQDLCYPVKFRDMRCEKREIMEALKVFVI